MSLQHEFRRTGQTTRVLPTSGHLVEGFRDDLEIAGGPSSASGAISSAEYTGREALYTMGTTWLVKDTVTGLYIWGGQLNDPKPQSDGTMLISAEGWGKLADAMFERFFVLSYNLDAWVPGDQEPLVYGGHEKIMARLGGDRMSFKIRRRTHFRRNQSNNPAKWHNGFYRWLPGTYIKYVKFDIDKSGNASAWDIELVGAIGPNGSLTVIDTYNMGSGGPTTVTKVIAGDYDLIGIRLARTTETRNAKVLRFIVKNLRIGSLSTDDEYTLNDAFVELFTRMGATTTGVSASTVNVAPFEAERGTYGQVADELSLSDNWFWRIEASATGAKAGNAGPMGKKTWRLSRTHSPVELLPEQRFSHVHYTYRMAGVELGAVVEANPNPVPAGYERTFELSWDDPPRQVIAQLFAQQVANYLATDRQSGSASFTYVEDPEDSYNEKHGTVVAPGDVLELAEHGNKEVVVSSVQHDDDGSITNVELATGQPILDKWLSRRQRLLNKGVGADRATMAVLELEEPNIPTGLAMTFYESETRRGRRYFSGHLDWNEVTEDIAGNGTVIVAYEVRIRPTNSSGTPIDGERWRTKIIRQPKDGESVDLTAWFGRLERGDKWYWIAQIRARDLLDQLSDWSAATTHQKPSATAPPTPTNVKIFDRATNRVPLRWNQPNDADDSDFIDQRIAYAQVQISTSATFATILDQERARSGERVAFKLSKADEGTPIYGRIRNVDLLGNKSQWVEAYNPEVTGHESGNSTPGATPDAVTTGKEKHIARFSISGEAEVKTYATMWTADRDYTLKKVRATAGDHISATHPNDGAPQGATLTLNLVHISADLSTRTNVFSSESRLQIESGTHKDSAPAEDANVTQIDADEHLVVKINQIGSTEPGSDIVVYVVLEERFS